MIAFNLGMDLNIFIFFLKHCEKLFCYQVGYFKMWIFEGLGACIKECLNFYLHAMQCSMNFTKSQSQRCLFGTWCYFYLCLYVSNNLPEIFVIITMKSSNGSTLIYDDVCAFIQHFIQYLWTVLASVMQYLFTQWTESETNIYKKEVKNLYKALEFRLACTWRCVRYIID